MNFATLKGLTIPEGNVSKIEDAQGNVLWSAVEMVQVTLQTSYGPKAIASINGENINLNVVSVYSTYDVPVGAGIVFINTSKAIGDVNIMHIDGTMTTHNITANGGSFSYTVIGKTRILASPANRDYGPSMYEPNTPVITITEIPESYVNVRVTTFKNDSSSSGDAKAVFTFPEQIPNPGGYGNVTTLTLNASSGNKAFYAPPGTTVACTVKQEKGNALITLNGTNVKKGSGTYNYTVTKDVHIDLTSYHEESNDYGRITITEQ